MQALNYTPKALEALREYDRSCHPSLREGFAYIAGKLEQAQVFVLPDHGQLLDRGKPRAEVPGLLLKPPFPVAALEYSARGPARDSGIYTAAPCPKRIAIAWEWQDDLPASTKRLFPMPDLGPGVVIASLPFYSDHERWMPIAAAAHIPYDNPFAAAAEPTPFHQQMMREGRVAKGSPAMVGTPIPILPAVLAALARSQGGPAGAFDVLMADLMDEVNAFVDLAYALACSNVRTQQHPAPAALNKARSAAGRLPLRDFHTLMVNGSDGASALMGGTSSVRSHLRRGHIRRLRHLGPDRITWVNAAMVRGSARGFADKSYDMRGSANG
jgi:hypothetical protein